MVKKIESRRAWFKRSGPYGWLLGLSLLLALGATSPGFAQAPPAGSAAAAESRHEVIAPADIPARADADEQLIVTVVRRAHSADAGRRLEQSLAERAESIKQLSDKSSSSALALLSVRRLESLHRHWQLHEREIARSRAELARVLQSRSEDAADLAARRNIWQATRVSAADSAPALVQRVDELIALAQQGEADLAGPLAKLLERGRTASALAAHVHNMGNAVQTRIEDLDRRLLVIDAPPLWQAAASDEASEPVSVGLRSSLEIERGFARDHDASSAKLLPVLVLLALLLLPVMFWLKRRARQMVKDGQASALTMQILSRPLAAWLVLVALGAMFYDLQGPIMRQQIVMLLAWVPVLVLLQRRIPPAVGPWAYLSAVFYFFNVVASLFVGSLLVYRLGLLALNVLMLITLGVLGWRALRIPALMETSDDELAEAAGLNAAALTASAQPAAGEVKASSQVPKWLPAGLLLLACAVLLASALSNVLGNISLTTMLTGAVLDSSYAALALYAGASVLVALLQVLLARPKMAQLSKRHVGTLVPVVVRLGRILLVLGWVVYALQDFRIYRPMYEVLMAALTFQVALGGLTLSLGSVVAFVVASWASFWVARTLRTLLAEDVLPALKLPLGVGQSVSTISYYCVLIFGLLTALAAAGFKVGELAIVFGALGIGIGLGLQDVVRNFVAGLILMFERPIRPGDVVDVAGLTATVRDIGLRATTLTTFDGADVVLPNGMILADKLVNWTLTGNSRRINIDVSTCYEVSPQQTIAMLIGIAQDLDGIASFPPPSALLTGLTPGALTFNVRAWTTQQADWVAVRSAFAMRIRDAFAEANIVVPLPQRELHIHKADSLKGVLPDAAA
ncbi:mechanosensitive ion channel [Paucibacter sp. B2R-40]|uniref:mechanosensitive ion channel domain-containing protein n=1 Tax=Paucibacter sp. B2R-40 TaxID=2893554 RepID=UPI0021E39260|nr:mechanosensitive ion channel domain-containing protein [Paucibacter sp. B2R-40]MCV2353730.1 mechanosensitive ion channel [Paucibacter sp. B2R-40]